MTRALSCLLLVLALALMLLPAPLLTPLPASLPGVRAAPLCLSQPTRPYSVDVRLVMEEARIDRSLSQAELSARMGVEGARQVHGIHSHGLRLDYRIQPAALPEGEGYCFWLEVIEVVITYAAPTIYVASEHAPNGCNDQAVRQHEAEHEQVARGTFEYFRPRFGDRAARAGLPQPSAPVWTKDYNEETEQQLARLKEALAPVVADLQVRMEERQARVDSPVNYRLTKQRCPSW